MQRLVIYNGCNSLVPEIKNEIQGQHNNGILRLSGLPSQLVYWLKSSLLTSATGRPPGVADSSHRPPPRGSGLFLQAAPQG